MRTELRLGVLVAVALAAVAAGVPAAHAAAFEPVALSSLPMPAQVTGAAQPDWTPDGQRLVFSFSATDVEGSQVGVVGADGSGFRCLTCGLAPITGSDRPLQTAAPTPNFGKPFVFGDGRRVLVRQPGREDKNGEGVGAGPTADFNYAVLECAPSVVDCAGRRLVPLRLPAGGLTQGVQNREARVSPDGRYLAWTELRFADSIRMALGRLVRVGDRYEIADPRVLNPPYTLDERSEGWALAGPY